MSDASPLIRLDNAAAMDTALLVGVILTHSNAGKRVQFLVPAGQGKAYIDRIRVKISRLRKSKAKKGESVKAFLFRAESYPHTEEGLRFDMVLCWQHQTTVMRMMNSLAL